MKKKVLILTADVGNGHRTTAQALVDAFHSEHNDQVDIKVIDLFETLDIAPFNTSAASYELFSRNHTLQLINNFFFRLFNTEIGFAIFRAYTLARLFNPTKQLIAAEAPDIVISNHPIVSVVVSEVKRVGGKFFSVTAVVDIGTIWRAWADKHAELIISPTNEVSDQLIRMGVSSRLIEQPLFPIRQSLKDFRTKQEVCQELKLDPTREIVLVTGGGLGTQIMLKCVEDLVENSAWQIVIVCGRLEALAEQLRQRYFGHERIVVLGYMPRMQDLYNTADLIVAKPGPSTILEIELFNKPALLSWEVGEQEIGNIAYAVQSGRCIGLRGRWWETTELATALLQRPLSSSTQRRDFEEAAAICALILQKASHLR